MSKKNRDVELEVSIKLDQAEDEKLELSAFLFNRSGRLLAKEPLQVKEGQGTAKFSIEAIPQNARVKIGPDVENLKDLPRHNPITHNVRLEADEPLELDITIPKSGWLCWLKVPYLVNGTVEKGGDPVCSGEVDIYEVDFGYCFWRIPDPVIERVRDALIDVVVDPPPIDIEEFPVWPDWVDDFPPEPPQPPSPRPGLLGHEMIDLNLEKLPEDFAFTKERLINLPNARKMIDKEIREMSLSGRQAFLDREIVDDVKIKKLLYTSTNQFREVLIENFQAFRFWLCWPWVYWLWWPYCYSWEKIGTAELQSDGSFSETIWLSICNEDEPDLWFVVRQEISGAENVIYERHPVPCNTYWNHPSGDPVHLKVTDPEAVACPDTPPPDKDGVYVMPLGIGWDGWYEVEQAHLMPGDPISPNRGLFDATDPYGTVLDLQMQFHDGLRGLGVMYYRWSYRKEGTSTWKPIDTPITHRYLTIISGKPYIKSKSLGPDSVGSEGNLFEVPDPTLDWIIIHRADRRFAAWDTHDLVDGKYELKLEMFDSSGNRISDPAASGFDYFLPLADAVGGVWPVEDNPHVEPDGSIILHVHLDNQDTVAEITSVGLSDGSDTGECQFLKYDDKSTDTVAIKYNAYHPNDFLERYTLHVRRGKSGTSKDSITESFPPAIPPTPKTHSPTVQKLLGTGFDRCAFSIDLHTVPRTRNGYSRISKYHDHDTAAFALTPSS